MWPKSYKDYRKDEDLIKYQVESGKGIIGCEMHEFNGWGSSYDQKKRKKKSRIKIFIEKVLKKFKKKGHIDP